MSEHVQQFSPTVPDAMNPNALRAYRRAGHHGRVLDVLRLPAKHTLLIEIEKPAEGCHV